MGVTFVVLNAVLPQDLTRTNDLASATLLSGHGNKDAARHFNTVVVREVIWRDALGIIAAHPLFGVGVGGYVSYDTYEGDSKDFNATDPHNMILYEWAELGTIGLGIFLWLIGAILYLAWRAYRRASTPETRWLAGGAWAALAAYLAMSLTEPFWTRGDGLIFFLLVGIAANLASAPGLRRACDCAGTPCGGAAAAPPPRQAVVEQCPQGTMLAGRANHGDCGRMANPEACDCAGTPLAGRANHGDCGRIECVSNQPCPPDGARGVLG
jgi:O-antigen ligase